ncbi:hypothetical protein [Streptomyces sp. 4R-3d]|uniref:helix-turn-helix domain-containing protein n=1 Tax=Streptomyces sp. 4R-3d TaxID=2559605 RepID=UPI0010727724|nr:hypothetical protein [Streptomyces sp. 4R-3d]TFI30101.1 hypothetical protein E4P36_04955 [Streptomyces sp. 4R-3d]
MTTAARTLPAHGTLHRRKTYKCDCEPCLAADRDYTNTRARLIAYGRWQPFVDAEPVRQHLRMLMSYGIGWQRVSRMAGVSNGSVSQLLYGSYNRGGSGPTKRVRTQTADKICAITPTLDNVAPSARIDATGTRRRLQALVANGWPQLRLGTQLGVHHRLTWGQIRKETVEGDTARQVRNLYNQLWNVDPATRGVHERYITQAKRIAAREGWVPPGAWDDDYIDSPAATPDLGEDVDRYTAIAEDAQWLIDSHGYTRQQAAHRLGITSRHLERALAHGRTKVAA